MSTSLVSVVLPTYNGGKYLRQAIESCLSQSYKNWELIIVDDGSTDDTPEVIAGFVSSDHRIRAVRHEKNRRLPAALNSGFALAKGTYLTWTSDDNQYRPRAISMMVDVLNSKPDVDIVYADYTIVDETAASMRPVSVGVPEDLIFINPIGPCFLYKRVVQDVLDGYREDLFMAEDYDFWLRASCLFRFSAIHQDLYRYRVQPNALTHRRKTSIRFLAEEALNKNLPLMNWLNNTLRARGYIRLLHMAQIRGDVPAMRSYLGRALRYSPGMAFRQMRPGVVADILLGRKHANRLRAFNQLFSRKNI
ncbi:MAG: glycosyltransferase [Deltaproteobacteria bacterium]|nr:glycosyltransferase [Deltaproteobacteria bacterium]